MTKPMYVTELGLRASTTPDGQVLIELIDQNHTSLSSIWYTPESALEIANMLIRKARNAKALSLKE